MIAGIEHIVADCRRSFQGQPWRCVANLSIGGNRNNVMNRAVRNAVRDGVVIVAAAGNEEDDACRYSPAMVEQAVVVGATDITDAHVEWSNYGRCVDVYAPGFDIPSAQALSGTGTETMSGTSMAAPRECPLVAPCTCEGAVSCRRQDQD